MTELKDNDDEFEDIENDEDIMRVVQNGDQQRATYTPVQAAELDVVNLLITLQ